MWGQQNKLSAVKDVLVKLYIGSIVYIFKSLKLDIFTNKAAGYVIFQNECWLSSKI